MKQDGFLRVAEEVKPANVQLLSVDFNYATNPNQSMALMPSWFAKNLIELYKQTLLQATPRDIVSQLMDDLRQTISDPKTTIARSLEIAQHYIEERNIIDNIDKEGYFATTAILQDVTEEQMTTIS